MLLEVVVAGFLLWVVDTVVQGLAGLLRLARGALPVLTVGGVRVPVRRVTF